MKLKFKSAKRREYEKIEKLGRWHQIFAWRPVKLDRDDGVVEIVWLQKVARKCTMHAKEKSNSFETYAVFKPRYSLPEDVTVELLEDGNDKIQFDDYKASGHYRGLKSDLGIYD